MAYFSVLKANIKGLIGIKIFSTMISENKRSKEIGKEKVNCISNFY
jgi:hypothetical protein